MIYLNQHNNIDRQQPFSMTQRSKETINPSLIRTNSTNSSEEEIINANGIVSSFRLILIACLILVSVGSIAVNNNSEWGHIKGLFNYFNFHVLGNDYLGIYDEGYNIDESATEFVLFGDMHDHFENLFEVVENFTFNGFPHFSLEEEVKIDVQFYYQNGTFFKESMLFSQFAEMVRSADLREFILDFRVMFLEIDFGSNKIVDSMVLTLDYEVHSWLMLELDLQINYHAASNSLSEAKKLVFRSLEQFFATLLLISYFLEGNRIYHDKTMDRKLRKNTLYWCGSLILLNFITLSSGKFAPMCSFLQLLPVFQSHDSAETGYYNFNSNLRYALPIVFGALTPIYIFLNGFIFYSLLMYPGDYFDDYLQGFFSYVYNNYQVGTYQIFMELKNRGTFAYLLYSILYFYMCLVGNNLITALFCLLIYKKMTQYDLMRYIENRVSKVVCPKCNNENYRMGYGLDIKISSPRSPYLKYGTTLTKQRERTAKMIIEEERPLFEINNKDKIKKKHQKIMELHRKLNSYIQKGLQHKDQLWINNRLQKIKSIKNSLVFN